MIFCWGDSAHGELGIGPIDDDRVAIPRKVPCKGEILQISCGLWHTLFLTEDGRVLSCGSNENGQLGHEQTHRRPHPIELDNYVFTKVSCGARHSHALSEWGQLFSWGHNDYGQLGLGDSSIIVAVPKMIKTLGTKTIIQVASGNNHSLALSNCGELYSWGSNFYGQLGVMPPSELSHSGNPRLVSSLLGIPIAFIACGGNHSFIISKSGAVFGWGRNNCGQLGLNDDQNRYYPTQLKTLRSLGVCYIDCGDEFSVFLTHDGGVFTCGSGTYGQLGHGNNLNEMLPRMVVELMGSTITQIACGRQHTLALVPTRGRIYGFGLTASGQLGTNASDNYTIPQVVNGPWVSSNGSVVNSVNAEIKAFIVKQVFSGGDHSFATTTFIDDQVPAVDYRIYDPKTQILHLTKETAMQCSEVGKNSFIDLDLLNAVEIIFKSQNCMNGSFLLKTEKHLACTSKYHGIDFDEAEKCFKYLTLIENERLKDIIWEKITTELLPSLTKSPADVESLRIYLSLPLFHEFVNSKNYDKLHTPFSNAVLGLNEIPKKIVAKWWAISSAEWFERLVSNYKNVVAHIINFKFPTDSEAEKKIISYNMHLVAALEILVILHRINHTDRKDKLHYESFHWTELMEYVDLQQNYIHWLFDKNPNNFNICNYPFLFNATAKTTLLQTDQAIQMHAAMQNAVHSAINAGILSMFSLVPQVSQFIVLNVTRENLVEDTLREIMNYNESDLKKPLKIKFHGEEAEDAGGVRKEFFMLLLKELFDPKYGMFKEFKDSRTVWFADITFETDDMYLLIGVICGLAIYNFTIINLPFPLALYKKLLNEPVDINDLRDLSPLLANSMQSILDYEDSNFVEVFDLRFEITRDVYGYPSMHPLKPNGSDIVVTLENKKEFVDLYIDFIFNKSVETQFKAFQRGFMKVCWGRVLQIFRSEELMAAVVGNEDYDWKVLELNCEYKNGYSAGDETVRWFWEVFHDLPESEKKKFLLFLTGSNRIPIQGMKEIKIFIQPTQDERFLPVAHTCFNLLDLPRYKTKERMKFKLLQAIQQTQGFSLV